MRLAPGRIDTDGLMDLAMLLPSSSGLASGVYFLRNEGADFSVSQVSTGLFATGPGKLVIIEAPDGGRDAVAARASNSRVFGWAPGQDAGTYQQVLTDGGLASDIAAAKLTGWTGQGLVTARTSGVSETVAYPLLRSGSDTSIRNVKSLSGPDWEKVAAWRSWLVLADAPPTSGMSLVFNADGGVANVGAGLGSADWFSAQEFDVTQDGETELFMEVGNGVNGPNYAFLEYAPFVTPPPNPAAAKDLRFADGGFVPVGTAYALGVYGFGAQRPSLVTVSADGVRRYENFVTGVGGTAPWVVNELPSIDAGTGFVAIQAQIADMGGTAKNDLVLIDANGTIKILITP